MGVCINIPLQLMVQQPANFITKASNHYNSIFHSIMESLLATLGHSDQEMGIGLPSSLTALGKDKELYKEETDEEEIDIHPVCM